MSQDLDRSIAEALSMVPSTHYDIAEREGITPREAELSLRRLADQGLAIKNGSGSWMSHSSGEDQTETPKRKIRRS